MKQQHELTASSQETLPDEDITQHLFTELVLLCLTGMAMNAQLLLPFSCAIVDFNDCNDTIASNLNRGNSMRIMYGSHCFQSFDTNDGELNESKI
jgi:hypothetical protein